MLRSTLPFWCAIYVLGKGELFIPKHAGDPFSCLLWNFFQDFVNFYRGKFKKKPNIIYILSDDIGFGELGWQGGGKHRGTPGPGLDDAGIVIVPFKNVQRAVC